VNDAIDTERELLAVAHRCAEAAAEQLRERFGGQLDFDTKSTATDPVSAADLAAETAIRDLLARERPGDLILGEEGGLSPARPGAAETGLRWVVDPLDGTVNYLYGIPQFAVSVGVQDGAGTVAGVVCDPLSGETFAATRGGPATLSRRGADPEPIRPRSEHRLGHALVATGFAYDAAVRARQGAVIVGLLPRVRDIRRAGAAALDLCAVAAGRLDAYFERGVKPWDITAGALLCERAGLVLRTLPARGDSGAGGLPAGILVASAGLVDELTQLIDTLESGAPSPAGSGALH
jgi:myo-inositol-1(or 4)-monophosphatase